MSRGINIAESVQRSYGTFTASASKPVVFLSHKNEDKDFVEGIGNYFMNAGIDIYLDKNDFKLQQAVAKDDPRRITECIQDGIAKSDYILCIASEKTVRSWWVPYEVGYGKKANKGIASLLKNDVVYIPDYLKIEEVIQNISGLNNFITKITTRRSMYLVEKYNFESTAYEYIEKSSSIHPLAKYLKS